MTRSRNILRPKSFRRKTRRKMTKLMRKISLRKVSKPLRKQQIGELKTNLMRESKTKSQPREERKGTRPETSLRRQSMKYQTKQRTSRTRSRIILRKSAKSSRKRRLQKKKWLSRRGKGMSIRKVKRS
jgi:hypothetical protein